MSNNQFPHLSKDDWQASQKTLQVYAQILGKIRRALTPPQRHWAHVSLRVGTTGLTTTAIPAGPITFDLTLDLTTHKLVITTSRGDQWHTPLYGQSAATFCEETLAILARLDIQPDIDRSLFEDTSSQIYHRHQVEPYRQALTQIDAVFKEFKGKLRGETSPVQLWPHHIDLAFLWFSGRFVPGQDPENEEYADEQMNFGFSPGDGGIPEPYFYITAYPVPNGFTDSPLPPDATWHSKGFTGVVMMYEALTIADDPAGKLRNLLSTVHQAGANLMK